MQSYSSNIWFKCFALLLVMTLSLPSAIKLAHTFEDHDHRHEVCINASSMHLHSLDLDCEFSKFKTSNSEDLPNFDYDLTYEELRINRFNNGLYHFSYNHRQLPFSLRGPPLMT